MFFPLFGRFIKAYKVKMCSRLYLFLFGINHTLVAVHINPILLDWTQTAQQEIERKKKVEQESRDEKETPSPNKAGAQKV